MTTNAIQFRMPAGIPGALSRDASQSTVEPAAFNSAAAFPRYGMFGKTVSDKFVPLASGDAATAITGVLVRPFPTQSSQDGMGTSTPPTSGVGDRLRRGYMSVLLALGTAAKDAQVYVVTTAGGTVNVGDIVTSASPAGGGTAVAVAGCVFTGAADANGVTEIAFNI
jgi:hypothetical protein